MSDVKRITHSWGVEIILHVMAQVVRLYFNAGKGKLTIDLSQVRDWTVGIFPKVMEKYPNTSKVEHKGVKEADVEKIIKFFLTPVDVQPVLRDLVLFHDGKVPGEHDAYLDVYRPVGGWEPLLCAFYKDKDNPEGMWDVAQTGMWTVPTKLQALVDAVEWSFAEGIPCKFSELTEEEYNEVRKVWNDMEEHRKACAEMMQEQREQGYPDPDDECPF